MISKVGSISYIPKQTYKWDISSLRSTGMFDFSQLDEICTSCDSVKDKQIESLKAENSKLTRRVEFFRKEIRSLELKTALDEPAVPLRTIVKDLTSTPEGKAAWEASWEERAKEWQKLVQQGKMSKIKYHRLINGMDQAALSTKLGVAQPNISRLERPGYNVPTKTLKKLAGIFGVVMEDLIGS